MSATFSFPSREHLKSRKKIQYLFSNGQSCAAYPIVLVWSVTDESDAHIQMAVSVSKKKFKKAVDRNRLKRQLREVWRLNKASIITQAKQQNQYYACMLIYTAKEHLPYDRLNKSMIKVIKKWSSAIG
ncbi:MAG: ribonuclease P protein component [Bacteroidota bacterium]